MRISKRLYKITEKVRKGETVADIGTDHGYVPMLLTRDGTSPHVIMSDISSGSLAKAIETFRMTGLRTDMNDFRVGDGLETIAAGEVDVLIIAGLGGFTIIDILAADPEKSHSFSKLILQPRKHSGNLRYFLARNGWKITDEDLAPEGKFVCEVITAIPAAESRSDTAADLYPEEDIRWKYPSAIVQADPVLARKRIMWKIGSIEEQLCNLSKSNSDSDAIISTLESDKKYLEELITGIQ